MLYSNNYHYYFNYYSVDLALYGNCNGFNFALQRSVEMALMSIDETNNSITIAVLSIAMGVDERCNATVDLPLRCKSIAMK